MGEDKRTKKKVWGFKPFIKACQVNTDSIFTNLAILIPLQISHNLLCLKHLSELSSFRHTVSSLNFLDIFRGAHQKSTNSCLFNSYQKFFFFLVSFLSTSVFIFIISGLSFSILFLIKLNINFQKSFPEIPRSLSKTNFYSYHKKL
jgi:hypothetical protein